MNLVHLKICSCNVHQIFLETSRLSHLSNASRMTLLYFMSCELWLSKVEVSAQSGILEQFRLYPVFDQPNVGFC